MKIGFDNDKYLKIQSEHIRERIAQFDGKLYLELGGPRVCSPVSSPTRNCGCSDSFATSWRLSSW